MDWAISSKFGTQIDFHFLKLIPSLNPNPEVHFRLYGSHLEKSIWRQNSADDRSITTKFGRQMKYDMPMTMHGTISKPQIEFQYGGRPFFKTWSSFISAVDWDSSSKFGMQIDFHHLKQLRACVYNKNCVIYPLTWVDEIKFLPYYTCDERWALHTVIKRKVFYIYFRQQC